MAKYLENCLFISTKALKCVMVLEKAIKIYFWTSQWVGGLECVAWFWGGSMAGNCAHLAGECCLDLCTSFLGLGCSCRDLGNWGVGVQVGFL